MENKIQVAEARVNGDWCNIKTPEGKEMSIMLSKCPKLKVQIEGKVAPFEIEGKVAVKGDKTYLWDVEEKKEGKDFKAQPRNEKLSVAQTAYKDGIQYLVGCKSTYDLNELDTTAKHIFDKICQLGGIQ